MKICILAAGRGTRMGHVCNNINKALLPLNNKAIISHIIEKFSKKDSFVIGLGYKGEQVKSYLKTAHPDKKFEFVNIKNFDVVITPKHDNCKGSNIIDLKKYLLKNNVICR